MKFPCVSVVLVCLSVVILEDSSRDTRPVGTQELAGPMPDNSQYLFQNGHFSGWSSRIEDVTGRSSQTLQSIEQRADNMSSARWNLSPGMVVVFYENASGDGDQLAVWGHGEAPHLSQWK